MSLAKLFLIIGAILVITGIVAIGTFTFFLLLIGFALILVGTIILKLLKTAIKIAIVIGIVVLGVILFSKYVPENLIGVDKFTADKLYCDKDTDCLCNGINPKDNSCYFGNKVYYDKFIKNNQTCPDFCSGIAANLRIACVSNKCTQVQIK